MARWQDGNGFDGVAGRMQVLKKLDGDGRMAMETPPTNKNTS